MKTRYKIIIASIVVGSIFTVFGTLSYFETGKRIQEYPSSPLHKYGSNLPYPSYDGTWILFEISGFIFAAAGLSYVIWRKR